MFTVAAHAGYHVIGARIINEVALAAATSAARAGYHSYNSRVWSSHDWKYSSWSWDGCLVVTL